MRAGFAERRRAVLELVKSIEVASPVIAGQRKPVVTVTYRFSEPAEPQWGIDPSPLLETARVPVRLLRRPAARMHLLELDGNPLSAAHLRPAAGPHRHSRRGAAGRLREALR